MFTSPTSIRRFELIPHSVIGVLVALLLIATGQPITTDDLWWHLSLGNAYAQSGPWLTSDPLLFTAPGPPVAAAWLADLGLASVAKLVGFSGLRLLHVLLVAAILSLAWSLFRDASRSRVVASLCTGAFIALSAYRLVQLRPHLLTMLFTLVLYRLLLESAQTPSRRRVAAAVLICAIWPNLHAGFLLGPVLLVAGIGGLVLYAVRSGQRLAGVGSPRVVGLGIALLLGTLATVLSPAGLEPHMAYFVAGSETPSLTRVGDEWAPLAAFQFPQPGGLPTPEGWVVFWGLLSGSLMTAVRTLLKPDRVSQNSPSSVDPVLVALALLGVVAPLIAVRFLWLGIFPLLLLCRPMGSWLNAQVANRNAGTGPPGVAALGASTATALLLLIGFVQFGDWPGISRSVPSTVQRYADPYFAAKYQAHGVWMLDDAQLEGNLFNEYYMGGFIGYWLSPGLRTFINGSLNVREAAMEANLPIRQRRGALTGESFAELLERQEIDIFFGIGLPRVGLNRRLWQPTTTHLENTPGWRLVFRNITSSLYLRSDTRNADNLARVEAYYRDQGVPFDSARGFDPARVIRESPSWAIANGVVPVYYDELIANARSVESAKTVKARSLLASFYAALGLYEDALQIDRRLLEQAPDLSLVRRRLAWCSLHVGAYVQAAEAARFRLNRRQPDRLLQAAGEIARAAIKARTGTTVDQRLLEEEAEKIAGLRLFTYAEARNLRSSMATPELRNAVP
jgi:hypothetical protein